MGAQLWYHHSLGHADPGTALEAIQSSFLVENYNLPTLLPHLLGLARGAEAAAQGEGDPYGILNVYRDWVKLLEQLCNERLPDNHEGQIDILRQLNAYSGEGIGNVLDVTAVGKERNTHKAQRLGPRETLRLVGTERPSLADAHNSVGKINEELGRGECVCFPIFEAGLPVGWYFVGNTID